MTTFMELTLNVGNNDQKIILPIEDILQVAANVTHSEIVLKHNPNYKYPIFESYEVVKNLLQPIHP